MDHRSPERLDAFAEQLTKQLQEVQVEREELAIAERVLKRLAEQAQADVEAVAPVSAKVSGRTVLLIPHHSDAADEGALPGDYRRILVIVREADGRCRSGWLVSSGAWTRRCVAGWSRFGRR